jgi:hypothetical protein
MNSKEEERTCLRQSICAEGDNDNIGEWSTLHRFLHLHCSERDLDKEEYWNGPVQNTATGWQRL